MGTVIGTRTARYEDLRLELPAAAADVEPSDCFELAMRVSLPLALASPRHAVKPASQPSIDSLHRYLHLTSAALFPQI